MFQDLTSWRGFDLTAKKRRLSNFFAGKPLTRTEDFPVIVNTPTYFAYGNHPRDAEYWTSPKAMLDFQTRAHAHHQATIPDDAIPYFMPWFGTGVLAGAFGCPMYEPQGPGEDPGVRGPCIQSVQEAARARMPVPGRDGWMPRVLEFIDYARANGDLPIGPSDLNSPLSTLAQMCGYDNLFVWMYDEPKLVHDLMGMVVEAFIAWLKLQKEHTGEPLTRSNGLQGVWSPEGVGVWLSDDDLVSVGAELYEEFVVDHYSRIFTTFGGGSLHYCGKGNHQIENFKKIRNLRVINNSPMGDFATFAELVDRRPDGVAIQIQDNAPANPITYYDALFRGVGNLDGIMVSTWILDTMAMDDRGGYRSITWDSDAAATNTVGAVRAAVGRRLDELRGGTA